MFLFNVCKWGHYSIILHANTGHMTIVRHQEWSPYTRYTYGGVKDNHMGRIHYCQYISWDILPPLFVYKQLPYNKVVVYISKSAYMCSTGCNTSVNILNGSIYTGT